MPWIQWKEIYLDSKVLSRETGFDFDYGQYPLGNYRQTNSLLFNVEKFDNRLFAKERVLGVVVDSMARVYRFNLMDPDGLITVINDTINSQPIIIAGNQYFMVAFLTSGIIGVKVFEPLQDQLPVLSIDNLGNQYDIFGEVVAGLNAGQTLSYVEAFMGYFFAFGCDFSITGNLSTIVSLKAYSSFKLKVNWRIT